MTLSSQQYANLADHSYGRDQQGNAVDLESLVDRVVEIDGVDYKVLAYADNPRTGYQGTIYQQVDSGEIVVAHRGTEFEREALKDGLLADGGMVFGQVNSQARDAIELTREALRISKAQGSLDGSISPEVTVTGHSLGGTLAQITAHHFDLRGETFNSYGAASLNYRIPEGGDRVLNHVMASDVVSSGSPHYGQTRTYAQPDEIARLHQSGYHDNRIVDALIRDMPVAAAGRSIGAHSMHHFLNMDGDGRTDISTLRDPSARQRAEQHSRMIDDYRGDVEGIRRGITRGAQGPGGWVQDGVDWLRGPVEAGEPAAREAREQAAREARELSAAAPTQGPDWLKRHEAPETTPAWMSPLKAHTQANEPTTPEARDRTDAADVHARLDRLLAGQIDPAMQQAWDREVASHHQRMEPSREQEAQQHAAQQVSLGR